MLQEKNFDFDKLSKVFIFKPSRSMSNDHAAGVYFLGGATRRVMTNAQALCSDISDTANWDVALDKPIKRSKIGQLLARRS